MIDPRGVEFITGRASSILLQEALAHLSKVLEYFNEDLPISHRCEILVENIPEAERFLKEHASECKPGEQSTNVR